MRKKEELSDESFNLRNYLEQELGEIIKIDTVNSNSSYLSSLIEAIGYKKSQLIAKNNVLAQKAATENSKLKSTQTYKIIKGLEQDYIIIYDLLSSTEESIKDDVRFTKVLKKRLDRILAEKERINSELFVLDLIRDMKINDSVFEHIKSFDDKIRFARNVKEIENQIMMYEKAFLTRFYELQERVEHDFLDTMLNEMITNRYQYTPTIIEYFRSLLKEDQLFQIISEQFIIKIKCHDLPNSYNNQNADNISIMIGNFFGLVEKFFDRRVYTENDLMRHFDEDLFNKFTGFFFEKSLGRYFDIILLKNLKNNNYQFFLDYMERIHDIFEEYTPQFERVKVLSIFLHELLYAYKSAAMAKYYEDYFIVEEKNFIYCQNIYTNLLKEKLTQSLGTKRPKQFEEISETLRNEKIEEYFNMIKKSVQRALTLCESSFVALNITKLIKFSLEKFESFLGFIIDNIKPLVPIASQEKAFVSVEAFRVASQIYIYLLRMNVDQKHYIENITHSIYFGEVNLMRKGVLESLKKKLEEFVNRCVGNILENASMNLKVAPSSNTKIQNDISILAQVKKFVEPYLEVITQFANPEFKKTVEIIFFRKAIHLIEMQLLTMDSKVREKFNFQNELAPFFEMFKPAEHKELVGDINALRYLLLFLKSKERDIYQMIEPTHKDLVNLAKLEMYNAELNKRR